jgi:GTPase
MFFDIVTINVIAGNGGGGCVGFLREKFVPKGGPDGGDGGKGGDVIIKADGNLKSLLDLSYKRNYKAETGFSGEGKRMHGRDGKNLVIHVPVGTIIKDVDDGEVLEDLVVNGQEFVLAKGGKGGKGNSNFATSVNQTPYYAQKGIPGEVVHVTMELKLIADVGIIGFPNVGKSSLIARITASKPKIANYEFTTLSPNLGVLKYHDGRQAVLADVPGLIVGAHEGKGLGHQFLRHVERTEILIHVLDLSDFYERNPRKDFDAINNELELHNSEIMDKKQIVVFNKIDSVHDRKRLTTLKKEFKGTTVLFISASTGEGLDDLIHEIMRNVS